MTKRERASKHASERGRLRTRTGSNQANKRSHLAACGSSCSGRRKRLSAGGGQASSPHCASGQAAGEARKSNLLECNSGCTQEVAADEPSESICETHYVFYLCHFHGGDGGCVLDGRRVEFGKRWAAATASAASSMHQHGAPGCQAPAAAETGWGSGWEEGAIHAQQEVSSQP